jgi:hypothetical protein
LLASLHPYFSKPIYAWFPLAWQTALTVSQTKYQYMSEYSIVFAAHSCQLK